MTVDGVVLASKKRQRREARIRESYDRISAALAANDSKLTKNPTRIIPVVPGFSALSKPEIKSDTKDINKDPTHTYAAPLDYELDIEKFIVRSTRPDCNEESKLIKKMRRMLKWCNSTEIVEKEVEFWKFNVQQAHDRFSQYEQEKEDWLESFDTARRLLLDALKVNKEANKRLKSEGKDLLAICARQCSDMIMEEKLIRGIAVNGDSANSDDGSSSSSSNKDATRKFKRRNNIQGFPVITESTNADEVMIYVEAVANLLLQKQRVLDTILYDYIALSSTTTTNTAVPAVKLESFSPPTRVAHHLALSELQCCYPDDDIAIINTSSYNNNNNQINDHKCSHSMPATPQQQQQQHILTSSSLSSSTSNDNNNTSNHHRITNDNNTISSSQLCFPNRCEYNYNTTTNIDVDTDHNHSNIDNSSSDDNNSNNNCYYITDIPLPYFDSRTMLVSPPCAKRGEPLDIITAAAAAANKGSPTRNITVNGCKNKEASTCETKSCNGEYVDNSSSSSLHSALLSICDTVAASERSLGDVAFMFQDSSKIDNNNNNISEAVDTQCIEFIKQLVSFKQSSSSSSCHQSFSDNNMKKPITSPLVVATTVSTTVDTIATQNTTKATTASSSTVATTTTTTTAPLTTNPINTTTTCTIPPNNEAAAAAKSIASLYVSLSKIAINTSTNNTCLEDWGAYLNYLFNNKDINKNNKDNIHETVASISAEKKRQSIQSTVYNNNNNTARRRKRPLNDDDNDLFDEANLTTTTATTVVIPVVTNSRFPTPRGVKLVLSPLSQYEDRLLGNTYYCSLTNSNSSCHSQVNESQNCKYNNNICQQQQVVNITTDIENKQLISNNKYENKTLIANAENIVLERCALQSCAVAADLKIRKLKSSQLEIQRLAHEAQISLKRVEAIHANASEEAAFEQQKANEELASHGLFVMDKYKL